MRYRAVKIEVTQDDIDRGKIGLCSRCPVARAIQRATGNGLMRAGLGTVWQYDNFWEAKSPPAVDEFIERFDKGLPVEPFAFEMALPERAFVEQPK